MAATDERPIHEFPTGTIDDNSLLIMDRPTSTPGEYETEKFAIANLGLKLLGGIDFPSNLDTDEQDIFGAINEVNTKAMNIAAEYDETESYSKGDYCIYQNVAYRCIKASGTTTGTFVAADWTQIKVLSEVKANTGAINELNTKTNSIYKLEVVQLFNNVSISNNTEYNSNGSTIPHASIPSKTGYTPVAIVNVQAMGYYGSRILLYAWIDTGDGKIHFSAFNTMENFQYTPTVQGYAWVLYIKNELL